MSKLKASLLVTTFILFISAITALFVFGFGSSSPVRVTMTAEQPEVFTAAATGTAYTGTGGTLEDGTYYLSGDQQISTTITVSGTATLDLNGYMLQYNGTSSTSSVITVNSGGNLTLIDSYTGTDRIHTIDDPNDTTKTISITGGLITGGKRNGVRVLGTLTMMSGTIAGNTATSGGGVYVDNSSTFEMSGGKITANTATGNGGGVYIYSYGTFKMSDGTITGNNAASSGGGVYVYSSGTFKMSDGTITGNNATSSGGGVYANNTVDIGGNAVIKANTKSGGDANNLFLSSGKLINITPALTSDAYIGVTLADYTGVFTSGYNSATDPREYFYSDNVLYLADIKYGSESNEVRLVAATASVEVGSDTTYYIRINEAWSYASGNNATITLLVNVTASDALSAISGDVTLNLNGKTLYLNQKNIRVTNGGKFTLKDESAGYGGKITGGMATNGSGVYVDGSGTFTMEGGTISGNTATNGGGVYVDGSGTFTMEGGTISGNTATNGGGVWCSGTFTMEGGTISGNTATSGGGVYVDGSGTFKMSDGTITGNNATSGGGGVYANNTVDIGGNAVIKANTKSGGDASNLFLSSGKLINITPALTSDAYIGVTLADDTGIFTNGYNSTTDPREHFSSDNIKYYADLETNEVKLVTLMVTVEVDSVIKYFSNLDKAWNYALGKVATLKLIINVTASDGLSANSGDVTLNLNGKTLYLNQKNIRVTNGGKFTLKDESAGGGGKITGGYSTGGGCVSVNGSNSTFTMVSGTISGNTATNGGGVYVDGSGTFTMEGGTVSGNTATNGGGVYADGSGTFTMEGGTITGNEASSGGGVYVDGSGTFTMEGGTIINNSASVSGGGLLVAGGTKFTMTGGTISGNTATNGGGVFVAGTLELSGNVVISGNTLNDGCTPNNVRLQSGNKIQVTGSLKDKDGNLARISVTLVGSDGDDYEGAFTNGYGYHNGDDMPKEYFKSDNANKACFSLIGSGENGEVQLGEHNFADDNTPCTKCGFTNVFVASVTVGTTILKYETIGEAFISANDYTTDEDSPVVIRLLDCVETATSLMIESGKFITLDLNGYMLECGNDSAITVNGTFTLKDGAEAPGTHDIPDPNDTTKTISITGGLITGGKRGGVFVNGTFYLVGGAIAGNTADLGGGVFVNYGTFEMSGGTITGNTASKGGGVYVSSGTFKMEGGTISGNIAENGGGVCVGGGAFTMYNAAEISGNIATTDVAGQTGNGGGVCVGDDGTFYLVGGAIGGNTADLGAGVYVSFHGELTMSGGNIANNVANSGGGVFTHGKFTMAGGKISNNTAAAKNSGGGGVFASGADADFKLEDSGVISGNVGDCGAGVFVNGKFVMSGGTIGGSNEEDANIATRGGGGVFIAIRLYFEMTGGTITGNSAAFGGGVSVVGVFKMTGGTISKNTATGGYVEAGSSTVPDGYVYDGGGGVYIGRWFENPRHENVHIKHHYFSIGANYGIGTSVGYFKDGVFVMTGGAITENMSVQDGGGVYSYGAFELAGGEISSNTAGYAGGGVCSKYYSYLALTGGSIVNNIAATDEWGYGYAGGGVYVESTCMASLSGAPVIKDNTVAYSDDYNYEDGGDSYSVDNLYLDYEETISVIGAVEDGADIHIKLGMEYGTATNGYSKYNGTTDPNLYFFSDNERFPVILRGGEVVIATYVASVTVGEEETLYYEIEKAWDFANGKEAMITLLIYRVQTDSVLSTDSGSITLNLDGNTLVLNQNNIQVLGGEFTLIDGEGNSGYSNGQIVGGYTYTYGGCVYVEENAIFNMRGGNITSSEAAVYGGGVFVSKNATFTMSGGTISNNKAYHGGGVFVNYGTFKMEGGTIYGNTVTGYGGGVFITGGETSDGAEGGGTSVVGCALTMSGNSSISSNSAQMGGGVYVARYATFKMEGGTVSSNTVIAIMNANTSIYEGGNGGGVSVAGGTFILDGGTINGNIAKSVKNGDTYVGGNGGGVNVAGGYYDGEKLGDGEFKFISGIITSNKSENHGGGVYIDNDSTTSLSNGIIRSNNAVRGGGLYIADDVTFTMTSGTIGGSSLSYANIADYGGGVYVADNATFTLKSNGTISYNKATNGGGVFIGSNASFTLESGGTVSGNSATRGGGVYIDGSGTFTMEGGTISNSTLNISQGGGVFVNKYATFTMSGGTISGNKSTYGSGVHVDGDSAIEESGGTFTMEGGTISANEAVGYGGGVFVNKNANFIIRNVGTISGNKALNGGGVFDNGTFTMEGGTISSNSAKNSGGGVLVNKMFTMKSGIIGGNDSADANTALIGGGVCVANNATFILENSGKISKNSATRGGGVYVLGGEFTMGDQEGNAALCGTISNNTATNGGGVFVNNGSFTMYHAAEISGNVATTDADGEGGNGGGVCVNGGAFTMYSGAITGNYASFGGGVYVNNEFTLSGGTISGNKLVSANTKDSNVYLNAENTMRIIINSALVKDKISVGLTVPTGEVSYIFTSGYGSNNPSGTGYIDPYEFFFADNGVRHLWLTTDDGEIMVGHTPTEYREGKEATCTESGNYEYWYCSDCGHYFSDAVCSIVLGNPVIPAGHSTQHFAYTAPKCEKEGIVEHDYCTACFKRFDNDKNELTDGYSEDGGYKIRELGHDLSTATEEPTCYENGYERTTCSRSGCDYIVEVVIFAHHTVSKVDGKDRTCTDNGVIEHWHCSVCEHNFEDEACDQEMDSVVIAASGHNYGTAPEEIDWHWADDYSSCTATYTCKNTWCTDKEHTVSATVTRMTHAATCTEGGEFVYTATLPDGNHNEKIVPNDEEALGHEYKAQWGEWKYESGEWKIDVTIWCNRDDSHDGLSTTLTAVRTTYEAPTCIAIGKEVYTASVEFDGFTDSKEKEIELSTIPHSFSSEYTTEAATCTTAGRKFKQCTTEGCTAISDESTTDPATGHSWSGTVVNGLTKTEYTAFDRVNLDGLVIEFVCGNDNSHTHTFTGSTDTASVKYGDGSRNCLHADDTSVVVTVAGYGACTVDGLDVAKMQITAGDAKWQCDGSNLMSGYVLEEDGKYRYFPNAADDTVEVTNAVARFANDAVTVYYPVPTAHDGLYTVAYGDSVVTANSSGKYTAVATLTLSDIVNYEFAAASGSTPNVDKTTITVTKEWYAAICDNGFTGVISGWTFGGTAPTGLPSLEKGDSTAITNLTLKRDGVIEESFSLSDFAHYINNTMPAGSYTLAVTVSNVTVDGVEYKGFDREFTFTVSKATFTVSDIENIETTYNGELHIGQAFTTTPVELITSGDGVWADDDYKDYYGGATIKYSHETWNGTYRTETDIMALPNNKLFINAGKYTAYYKITAPNYNDITDKSFVVDIAKARYNMDGITFDDDNKPIYDGSSYSIEINIAEGSSLPDDVSVSYTYRDSEGKVISDAVDAGTYTVTAQFTGDYDNYEIIPDKTAELTINRAVVSLGNLTLLDKSYPYDGDPHSITFDQQDIPDTCTVEYKGNDKILRGEYGVTATFKLNDPKNYEFAAGTKTVYEATMNITLGDFEITGVSFVGKTVTYSGNAYSLLLSGKIPSGVTYSYENNNCVDVGTHTVIVHFYHSNSNYAPIKPMKAQLVIQQANYDLKVIFPSATVAYTGSAHSLAIRGVLPDGVYVSYTYRDSDGNVISDAVAAGTYTVTAQFTGDYDNYAPIEEMTATLKIIPASLGITSLSIESKTVDYDGDTHSLTVNGALPDGVTVKYYITKDGEEVEFDGATEVGVYDVVARFILSDSENYRPIRSLSARLSILASDVPVEPPVIVEPSVIEIDTPIVDNQPHSQQANAVVGDIAEKAEFPWWLVAVCIIGVEFVAIALIGIYILFWKPKKKKREDENGESHD